MKTLLALICGLLLAGSAVAGDGVELGAEGYARETLPGAAMSAAYLTLQNRGDSDLRLQGVELPGRENAAAELHTTVSDGGISRMRPLAQLDIPAGGAVRMAPGGVHLMLSDVKLRAGEQLRLRLLFAGGAAVEIEVPVRGLQAAEEGHHH